MAVVTMGNLPGASVSAFKRGVARERLRMSKPLYPYANAAESLRRSATRAEYRQGSRALMTMKPPSVIQPVVRGPDPRGSGEMVPGMVVVPPGGSVATPAPAPVPAPIDIVPEYADPLPLPASTDAAPLETDGISLPTTTEIKKAVANVPQWAWVAAGLVAVGGVAWFLSRAD